MRTTVQALFRPPRRSGRRPKRGQALVEFALAVIPFLILLMAVVDLGRGIYAMNATSEAARDIARATIVHLTNGAGALALSSETAEVIATQRSLVPGLTVNPNTDIVCVDAYDVVQLRTIGANDYCTQNDDFIRVHISVTFAPITPLVSAFGSHTFESTTRMKIP